MKLSMTERRNDAEIIVSGIIENVWTEERNNTILTAYTIRIYQIIKGGINKETLRIETPVGTIGNRASICDAFYTPVKQTEGIFFLVSNFYPSLKNSNNEKASYALLSEKQGIVVYDNRTISFADIWEKYSAEELSGTLQKKIELDKFAVQPETQKLVLISSYSPEVIRAGWSELLTINGFGFGSSVSNGRIFFTNADNGGVDLVECPSALITKWSDTQIIVKVPSRAGYGKFKIESPNGSAFSPQNLVISDARLNTGTSGPVYPIRLIGRDDNDGYRMYPTEDFITDSNAYPVFLDQIRTWRCLTGINWIIQEGGNKTQSSRDSVLMVGFDDANQLPAGVLGLCYQYYSSCSEGTWYLTEFDILFKRLSLWWYAESPPLAFTYDFASVCLHELGHAHQLGHVIITSNLMNYSISAGTSRRSPSSASVNSCVDICNEAASRETCGIQAMRLIPPEACEDERYGWLNPQAFPNPATDAFTLRLYPSQIGTIRTEFFDLMGKKVLGFENDQDTISTIDLLFNLRSYGFRNGVYLLKIQGGGIDHTQKIIVH